MKPTVKRTISPVKPAAPVSTPIFPLKAAIALAVTAVATFHVAYLYGSMSFLMAVFLFCLFALTHLRTGRQAFYTGLAIGLAIYVPHLSFFWKIFGPGAVGLWLVLAVFPALFLALGRACLIRFGPIMLACVAPFLWTGLEFFRSELYYLRFSWLTPGYAFSQASELPLVGAYGVYGIGFLLMAAASIFYMMPRMSKRTRIVTVILIFCVMAYPVFQQGRMSTATKKLHVAGVQLEYPGAAQVRIALDEVIKKYPEVDLVVLSEYSFDGDVPELIKNWCRDHQKHLIAGGKEFTTEKNYFNTAYVVGPTGEIVFKQAKCVPIQFFKDGTPAREQAVWDSPWGKLGLAICYDDGYTRVIDGLVRQGAQGLIIPTMDVTDWGETEHKLHSLILPMRAAEYGLPAFRVCSSGISQIVDRTGIIKATAPFPGEQAMLEGVMELPDRGHLPPDRWVAPASTVLVAAFITWLASAAYVERRRKAVK